MKVKITKDIFSHRAFVAFVFVFAICLIFFNEYSRIQTLKEQERGYFQIESIPSDYIDDAYEGSLIHIQGKLTSQGELSDELFGVQTPAIKMRRSIQVYQWQETIQDVTSDLGVSTRIPLYEKIWSSSIIDSSVFQEVTGHINPQALPYQRAVRVAPDTLVGVFQVDPLLLGMLDTYEPYPFVLDAPEGFILREGILYSGNPDFPTVGDVQIGFEVILPQDATLIAQQSGMGLVPFIDPASEATVGVMRLGIHTIKQLGLNQIQDKPLRTWILRVFAFLLMFWFFRSIKRPVFHVLQKFPAFGRYAHVSVDVILALVALQITLLCSIIMWFSIHPIISLIFLLIPASIIVVSHYLFLGEDE